MWWLLFVPRSLKNPKLDTLFCSTGLCWYWEFWKRNPDFKPPQFCILVVPPDKGFLEFFANSSPLFKNSFSTLAASMFSSAEITKWPCLTFTKIFPLREVTFSIALITSLKLGSLGLKSSDPTNFVGLDLAPTTVLGFRHMTKPWYSLTLFWSILCNTSLRPLEAGKPSLVSRSLFFLLLFFYNLSKWFTICLSCPGVPGRKTLSYLYTGWRGFHNIFCGNQPQRYTLQQKIGNSDKLYLEPSIFFLNIKRITNTHFFSFFLFFFVLFLQPSPFSFNQKTNKSKESPFCSKIINYISYEGELKLHLQLWHFLGLKWLQIFLLSLQKKIWYYIHMFTFVVILLYNFERDLNKK